MVTEPASFTAALVPGVSLRTRAKGVSYFRRGAVIEITGGEWAAHAIVRGTRDYRVELVRDGSRFTGACECPWYSDRADVCKHIWAALLEAESRGLLDGDGPVGDDAVLEPEYPAADLRALRIETRTAAVPGKPAPIQKVPAWQQFLNELRQDVAAAERALPQPRFSNGQIVYAIDVRDTRAGNGTVVNVLFRQRKKNGEWSKPRQTGLTPSEAEHLIDDADREIMSLLLGAASVWLATAPATYDVSYPRLSRYVLNGPLEDRLLPMLAATGRLHLQHTGDGEALLPVELDAGAPWRFDLRISSEDPETIRIDGAFVRGGDQMDLRAPVLVLSRGFLFTRTAMARLDLDGGFAWIARLRSFGPIAIPRDESATVLETLARSGLDPQALPPDLRYDVVDGEPRPRVRVGRPERTNPYATRHDLRATVQFDYGGTIVEAPPGATAYDSARRRLVRRNRAAEQTAIDRLHQLGFRYTWSHFESRQVLGISPDQFPRVVQALVAEGWRVEADGRAFRAAIGMKLSVSSGIDWFDLHGDVDFGDGRSAPFPQLLAAVERGDNVVVLDDGSVGLLPEEWLRRYMAIAAFGQADGDAIRFEKNQASLLDALLAAEPAIQYDQVFARVRAELERFRGIEPADPPPSFIGHLRGYQREALGWFEFLRRFGFGGCLADDMGLGKTVMVLALLEARRHERRAGAARRRWWWCRGRSSSTGWTKRRGSRRGSGCSITPGRCATCRASPTPTWC